MSARNTRRWCSFAFLLVGTGCSACGGPSEVRWPASPDDVQLADALAATAESEGRGPALSPEGTPIEAPDGATDVPGIQARSFVFDGLWVAEVVLGEAEPDAALPLVVMLHGRGDQPRIPGGPFARVPTPLRVLVPRGPLTLGAGYAWARYSVTQGHHDEIAADLVAIAERLARLIDHITRTRPTAGSPIVTGFSQGAMVAWTLAVRFPDRIGLAIPIAGWVPPAARPQPLRTAPTRAMHGGADPIVRIEPTREWVALLREAGNDVDWLEFEGVGHTITPEMNDQFEEWLEEAASARAPRLEGGLGEPGPDPEPVEAYEEPSGVVIDRTAAPAPLPEVAEARDEAPVIDDHRDAAGDAPSEQGGG